MTAVTETGAPGTESARASGKKPRKAPAPLTYGRKGTIEIFFLWVFVLAPWAALAAGVYLTWNTSIALDWKQAILFLAFYVFTGLGVTVGFHRFLTHGAFKAKRPLKIMLTLAGTMAIEGAPIRWVADHRRHHQFSDEENDPHSPWRFGESVSGLTKGLIWAHTGWLFTRENTNSRRFAPDLIADKDIRWFQKNFIYVLLFSLLLPTALGYVISGFTWQGAVAGYLWAGLVRIALVHHVTWSVNSVCHVFGERPFVTADKASNVWWLAILSFGESWHNLHHADPTSARHGVDKGQLDSSARLIWFFEKMGWATNVKWPKYDRLEGRRIDRADQPEPAKVA
jgi:stearoyl-CoA desaturase (Delta-9 desaturase)